MAYLISSNPYYLQTHTQEDNSPKNLTHIYTTKVSNPDLWVAGSRETLLIHFYQVAVLFTCRDNLLRLLPELSLKAT